MPVIDVLAPETKRAIQREIKRTWYRAGHAAASLVKAAADDPVPVYDLHGRLVLSKSGWGLLEVPNALLRGVFQALHVPGVELPRGKEGKLRGHISVLRPEDIAALGGPDKINEFGRVFSYQLGPLKSVKPMGWGEMSKVWFLSVTSPELQTFRKSYGLSPLPVKNGKELAFHITVAVRRRNVLRDNEVSKAAGVVAHIGGVGGAGKTTLLNRLQEKYPQLVTKDLDELDDQAKNELGLNLQHKGWKARDFAAHVDRFQGLLNQFVADNEKKPVVLGGFHLTGTADVLDVPTDQRIMLDPPVPLAIFRAWRRARRAGDRWSLPDAFRYYQNAQADRAEFKELGYTPQTPDEIEALVAPHAKAAADKATKAEADYGPAGTHHDRCGLCAHFDGQGQCGKVAGPIEPDHWCRYFQARAEDEKQAQSGLILINLLEKLAAGAVLQKLKDAKAESDRGAYDRKHAILRQLLVERPDEFSVDSHLNERYVGLTHRSGFKIHAPKRILPEMLKKALRLAPGTTAAAVFVPTRRRSHDRMTMDMPGTQDVPLAPPDEGNAAQILRALATSHRTRRQSRLVRIPTV